MAARRIRVDSRPPSLEPERAVAILEELIQSGAELTKLTRSSPEVTRWGQTCESALAEAFGSEHENVTAFHREFGPGFVEYNSSDPNERHQAFLRSHARGIAVLNSAGEQLKWKLPQPSQVFLPAQSQHDAFVEIRQVIQRATSEILVLDRYVDHTLWSLLTNVATNIGIRVLTENMKGDFTLEGKRFVAQHGNRVEARVTATYHDRFILLDRRECWHLGASIKDAGNRAFLISQIQQSSILQFVIADIESEWLKAAVVPL